MRCSGLELAKLAALPHEVMCRAADVAGQLTQLEEQGRSHGDCHGLIYKGRNSSLTNAIASRRRTLLEVSIIFRAPTDANSSAGSSVKSFKLRNSVTSNSLDTSDEYKSTVWQASVELSRPSKTSKTQTTQHTQKITTQSATDLRYTEYAFHVRPRSLIPTICPAIAA